MVRSRKLKTRTAGGMVRATINFTPTEWEAIGKRARLEKIPRAMLVRRYVCAGLGIEIEERKRGRPAVEE